MNKQDYQKYLKTVEIKIKDEETEIIVNVRGLKTGEYLQLGKAQQNSQLAVFEFLDSILENLIVKHNLGGLTNKDVADIIVNDLQKFEKFMEGYLDFLFPKMMKKSHLKN